MFWMFQIFGCGEKPTPLPADTAVEDTAVQPSDEPSTEPTGTDADGDGFTVEDGDCDDTSPWINPARDEETGDGLDNDCDGRIDEKWSGVTLSLAKQGETSSLLKLNQLGNVESGCVEQRLCAVFGPCETEWICYQQQQYGCCIGICHW